MEIESEFHKGRSGPARSTRSHAARRAASMLNRDEVGKLGGQPDS